MATCNGQKMSGDQCMGKAESNGFCRHHQSQVPASGPEGKKAPKSNVTPITDAPSKKGDKGGKKGSSSPVAVVAASTAGKPVTQAGPSPAAVASQPSQLDVNSTIIIGKVIADVQRLGKGFERVAKKGGGQPGHGNYGTLRDQLNDYAGICGDMEAELKALIGIQ